MRRVVRLVSRRTGVVVNGSGSRFPGRINGQTNRCRNFYATSVSDTPNSREELVPNQLAETPLFGKTSNEFATTQIPPTINTGSEGLNSSNGPNKIPKPKRRYSKYFYLILLTAAGFAIVKIYNNSRESNDLPLDPNRPKVVILGTGWGAMALVDSLDPKLYDVTIVSPRNYFLFTPLLPSVTVGTISETSIIEPIRQFVKRKYKQDVKYYEAKCTDVDFDNSLVTCVVPNHSINTLGVNNDPHQKPAQNQNQKQGMESFQIPYDKLIIAVGSKNNTFGIKGVAENCVFLKSITDASRIKDKLRRAVENASLPHKTDEERRKLLHFVVVGGGPTGVETAGELNDYVEDTMAKYYPHLRHMSKVTLVELEKRILTNIYDEKIAQYAQNHMLSRRVDILTRTRVVAVNNDSVTIEKLDEKQQDGKQKTEQIPFGMCVWATGIGVKGVITRLRKKIGEDVQTNRTALLTDSHLRVKGTKGKGRVYALGDCASIDQEKLMSKFVELFKEADVDGSNSLSLDEFRAVVNRKKRNYPQLELYGEAAERMYQNAMDGAGEKGEMSLEQFKSLLTKVDQKIRRLPATAQVAVQQGNYLGRVFNMERVMLMNGAVRSEDVGIPGFDYKHLGSFAYIGSDRAIASFVNDRTLSGIGAWWLWRSVYWSKQYSLKNKVSIAVDWTKASIFGRDITL